MGTGLISHDKEFIFIKNMKTGGSSIAKVLDQYGTFPKEEALNVIPQWSERHNSHITPHHGRASELIRLREFAQNWDNYFKFAFVRNPWSLLVSWYFHKGPGNLFPQKYPSFEMFILKNGWNDRRYKFEGCYDRICNEHGDLMVDFVGKYENLAEDFDHICMKIGLEGLTLPHKRKGVYRDKYTTYYTDETKEIVGEEFEIDIEKFGYKFEEEKNK